MLSRNSITLWETMMTNTPNGPFYIKRGTRRCRSTPITFIPYVQSWVSRTLSGTWFWNIAVVYIDTSELRWNSLTSLHLDPPIGMLSKSRRNFNKRTSETLELRTHHRRKTRETMAHKTQDKERTTSPHHKQRREMERQRRTLVNCGANFIKALGTTLMNVTQSSH